MFPNETKLQQRSQVQGCDENWTRQRWIESDVGLFEVIGVVCGLEGACEGGMTGGSDAPCVVRTRFLVG